MFDKKEDICKCCEHFFFESQEEIIVIVIISDFFFGFYEIVFLSLCVPLRQNELSEINEIQ